MFHETHTLCIKCNAAPGELSSEFTMLEKPYIKRVYYVRKAIYLEPGYVMRT